MLWNPHIYSPYKHTFAHAHTPLKRLKTLKVSWEKTQNIAWGFRGKQLRGNIMHYKWKSFIKCNWHEKEGKMISQQKWIILLFIYRIFPGTKENVFIKGLLAYKYKHINVGHWGHLAKLFSSNCLLVLSRRSLWHSLESLLSHGQDLIWLLALPSSMDTQHGRVTPRGWHSLTLHALLSLLQGTDMTMCWIFLPCPCK